MSLNWNLHINVIYLGADVIVCIVSDQEREHGHGTRGTRGRSKRKEPDLAAHYPAIIPLVPSLLPIWLDANKQPPTPKMNT